MMRPYRFVSTISLVASALFCLGSPLLLSQGENPASPEQIEHWISDLGARRFIVREEATMQLVETGTAMIPHLLDAIGVVMRRWPAVRQEALGHAVADQ